MPLVFKRNAFDEYDAFSGDCLIGSIEHRSNATGQDEYAWSIGALPPTPKWNATGHTAPDLETAMHALQTSFDEWLKCARLVEKEERAEEG